MTCPQCGSPLRQDPNTGHPVCDACLRATAGQRPRKGMSGWAILAIVLGGVLVVGVTLAAIAKPSFRKYIKKSKTAEASQFVKKLYDGSAQYYMDPPMPGLTPAEPQFPEPSAGPTPPLGTCCDQGGKCAPDFAQWDREPWRSLEFSIEDPHYYSYAYYVDNQAGTYTAAAYGDLDCDGVYSTFEMTGVIDDPDSPRGFASIRRINELE